MESDRIRVAHSPDSDDAFMFFALAEGRVDAEGLSFVHELSDIESLNRRALGGELEVSAVSFHAYAFLAERLRLLPPRAASGRWVRARSVSAREPVTREAIAWGRSSSHPRERTTAHTWPRYGRPARAQRDPSFRRGWREGRLAAGGCWVFHEGQLTFEREGLRAVAESGPVVERRDRAAPAARRRRRPPGAAWDPDRIGFHGPSPRTRGPGLDHRTKPSRTRCVPARGLRYRSEADRFVEMYVNRWTRRVWT